MTTLRTITGELRHTTGELLPETTIVIAPVVMVSGDGGDVAILGDAFEVTSDESGLVEFEAYEGDYDVEYPTSRGKAIRRGRVDTAGPWTMGRFLGPVGSYGPTLAQQVEDYAALAEAWAESPTPPDGLGTKSSKTWAGEARVDADRTAINAGAVIARAYFKEVSALTSDNNAVIGYAGSGADFTVQADDVIEAGGFRYEVAASGATDQHVTTAGGVKLYVLPGEKGLNAYAFGMPTGGNDQALLYKMWFSTADRLHMPPGLYHGYINNNRSGRTIHWDEGAILDGVIHIAVGRGPDSHGDPSITWVDNTRVIGTATSTVRVGSYYCRGVKADKFRITEINAAYVNQTTEGGTKGVHLYMGTKDFEVGEIQIDSATAGAYALSVDRATTVDADHKPENVSIGRMIVTGNTQAVLSTNDTVNLHIGEIVADSWDTYTAFGLLADTGLRIDKIKAIRTPVGPARDGIYVQNGVSASFGEVEIVGASQIGFRTFNCARVDADIITARGNATDQLRIESPGNIREIRATEGGTGAGALIQGGAAGLFVGRFTSDGGGAVQVNADDVTIPDISSKNNKLIGSGAGLGHGVYLNGCKRFNNSRLITDNNVQGLRLINCIDTTLGAMAILNNTYGIVGSGVSGWSHDSIIYSGNTTYDTNVIFETLPGFKGKRVRASVGNDRGDASVTLAVGTDAVTQRFVTPLTANRTVTLSATGAQNGDRFRVVRLAAATGAFNLTVAGKNLAAGQWADVEFVGGSWFLSATGSL